MEAMDVVVGEKRPRAPSEKGAAYIAQKENPPKRRKKNNKRPGESDDFECLATRYVADIKAAYLNGVYSPAEIAKDVRDLHDLPKSSLTATQVKTKLNTLFAKGYLTKKTTSAGQTRPRGRSDADDNWFAKSESFAAARDPQPAESVEALAASSPEVPLMNQVAEITGRLWVHEVPKDHLMLLFFRLGEDEVMRVSSYSEDSLELEFESPPPSDDALHQWGYSGVSAHFSPTAYTLPILPPRGEKFCQSTKPEFMKMDIKDPKVHLTDRHHYRWSSVKLYFKRDPVDVEE